MLPLSSRCICAVFGCVTIACLLAWEMLAAGLFSAFSSFLQGKDALARWQKKKRDGRKKGGKGHFFGCLDCGNGLAGKREVEVETTGARSDE